MTLGESRIRTTFNPSENTLVDEVKQRTAELINLLDSNKADHKDLKAAEKNRLISLALTSFEEAAMWSVKALTI